MTQWRKSTYSGSNGSNCVEVAAIADSVLVRDSTNRAAAILIIAPMAWTHLTATLRR